MALEIMSWLIAIPMLGIATGLRSLTPIAILCWYAYAGQLSADWVHWISRLSVAIVLTICAAGELVADKTPRVPDRVSPAPLLWRLVIGGFVGAVVATSMEGPGLEGVLLGIVGVLIGAFGGYMLRRDLVQKLDCKDWHVAVCEDLIAIIAAVYALRVISA
ncbi:MAG TPA: DUF4126 family protein [Acidobacteriaceae bacterium]|jgi:uncharacterized membrane protein|nr:DUF4126 family protein [Acidobacteriaceae bacterium]